jgi:hypothetical protein
MKYVKEYIKFKSGSSYLEVEQITTKEQYDLLINELKHIIEQNHEMQNNM